MPAVEVTRSLSNLLKSYAVVSRGTDAKIIDSNKAMMNAMDKVKTHMENESGDRTEFVQGLAAENVDDLLYSENDEDGGMVLSGNVHYDGFVGEKEPESYKGSDENIEDIQTQVRQMMETAESDAEAIIEDAKSRAAEILEFAKKEGYDAGYNEGRQNASDELAEKMSEIETMKQELVEEYEARKAAMEPELVDAILKVFVDVTHVLSEDRKDLIMYLVDSVVSDNLMSNNFFIRTSKEDADYLRMNKEKLVAGIDKEINIEIIEDNTMKKNECIVETDFGIFDSSLDIQLESLVQDIKLLACAVGNE